MNEHRESSHYIARLIAAVTSRRAALAGSFAALGLALSGIDAEESAARGRKHRRRRRRGNRGGNPGGGLLGDNECFVCEKLSDGPNCRFSSIQAAIDAAGNGALIAVCPGTYKERLTLSAITAPNLIISGSGPEDTVIDGEGDGSTITVDRPGFATIERFTITGGSADFGGGIVNRGFLTINDCVITGNDTGVAAGGGGGIYNDGGNLTLLLAQVTKNASLEGQGGGILNANAGKLFLQEDSTVSGNRAKQGGGIFNEPGSTVSIDSTSRVTGNTPNNCAGSLTC
jgi:hypothetical protein